MEQASRVQTNCLFIKPLLEHERYVIRRVISTQMGLLDKYG